MKSHPIYLIVAVDKNFGIGSHGKLPWHFKNEMKFFKETTTKTDDPAKQNLIIMGRITWQSIPENFRPLPGRKNAVLSSQETYEANGTTTFKSLGKALESADENIENIFIIGGAKVFNEAIKLPNLTGIYLTKIDKAFDCDTFFPTIPEHLKPAPLTKYAEVDITIDYFLYHS